jgi:hypothetical protein
VRSHLVVAAAVVDLLRRALAVVGEDRPCWALEGVEGDLRSLALVVEVGGRLGRGLEAEAVEELLLLPRGVEAQLACSEEGAGGLGSATEEVEVGLVREQRCLCLVPLEAKQEALHLLAGDWAEVVGRILDLAVEVARRTSVRL